MQELLTIGDLYSFQDQAEDTENWQQMGAHITEAYKRLPRRIEEKKEQNAIYRQQHKTRKERTKQLEKTAANVTKQVLAKRIRWHKDLARMEYFVQRRRTQHEHKNEENVEHETTIMLSYRKNNLDYRPTLFNYH